MASIEIKNLKNEKVGDLELADDVFAAPVNETLIWEAVRHFQAARRAGTVSTKVRSQVSGGGKKPWRQKGTGRARVGSSRNPVWRGGGTVFGPKPRDYDYAFPKKKRRGAIRAVLSSKLKDQLLVVLDKFELEKPATRDFRKALDQFSEKKCLIVEAGDNRNLELSARNLRGVKLVASDALNVYDLLYHEKVVFSKDAILMVQEALKNDV